MNFLSSNLLLDKLVSKCKEWVAKSNCISGSKIQNVQTFSQYSIKQTYISACIPLHISNLATITVHICTVIVILQIIILLYFILSHSQTLYPFFSLLLLLSSPSSSSSSSSHTLFLFICTTDQPNAHHHSTNATHHHPTTTTRKNILQHIKIQLQIQQKIKAKINEKSNSKSPKINGKPKINYQRKNHQPKPKSLQSCVCRHSLFHSHCHERNLRER